jgi:hypothetical protein
MSKVYNIMGMMGESELKRINYEIQMLQNES